MTFAPATLEAAIERLEALPDEEARAAAREAVSALLELHREGLLRLFDRLEGHPEREALLRDAAEDETTAGMLLLHGLHPSPLEAPVHRAPDPELIPPDRLLGRRPKDQAPAVRCELCSEPLGSEHAHLFDVERRKLSCACRACGALFDSATATRRRVWPKAVALRDLRMTDARWEALQVPVGLAFFSRSSTLDSVVAAYPGPAGAVESVVSPVAWEALVQDNPVLAELEADVTALLVDRRTARRRAYLLSIDQCYRLTGLVRSRWQGLHGGEGVHHAVEEFLGSLGDFERELAP